MIVTVDGEDVLLDGVRMSSAEASALVSQIETAMQRVREARQDRIASEQAAQRRDQARAAHPDGWAVGAKGWAWWGRDDCAAAVGTPSTSALCGPDAPEWVRVSGGRLLHRVDRKHGARAMCGAWLYTPRRPGDQPRCQKCAATMEAP